MKELLDQEEVDLDEEEVSEDSISIAPIAETNAVPTQKNFLLEMQLKMATSSINHEYARMEFDDTDCHERREELLGYMNDCRQEYFDARDKLVTYDPYALAEFEQDLLRQKLQTLSHFNA